MTELESHLSTLKRAILAGDDFDAPLRDLCRDHGEAVVRPLLTLIRFTEGDDLHHCMYAFIHTIESYGNDVFMPAILDEATRMLEKSPLLAVMLMGRICNSDAHLPVLMKMALQCSPEDRSPVAALLQAVVNAYPGKPKIVSSACRAIETLQKKR